MSLSSKSYMRRQHQIREWIAAQMNKTAVINELNQKAIPPSARSVKGHPIVHSLQTAFARSGDAEIIFLKDGLYVTKSQIVPSEKGLYCLYDILPHTLVGEIQGKKITYSSLNACDAKIKAQKIKYLVRLGEKAVFLDPTDDLGHPLLSNPMSFVNEPVEHGKANMYIDYWAHNSDAKRKMVYISGCQTIPQGEELSVHYGFYFKRNYRAGDPCRLGTVDHHLNELHLTQHASS